MSRVHLAIGVTAACLVAPVTLQFGPASPGPGVGLSRFPGPHDFVISNKEITRSQLVCSTGSCHDVSTSYLQPDSLVRAVSPYFPPFTHFVLINRENHTFDDYLGDCATTIQAGCNGEVQSTNHISSVPDLHKLAKQYALDDAYSTGTQPPNGPNHWWMFSAQSASGSQQQSWPSNHGTQFDRFLHGDSIPVQGTNPCSGQTKSSGTGSSPYTFMVAGDIYWMLNEGSGYWRNPKDGRAEVLPIDRPGTKIPEELDYNQYTCSNKMPSDSTVANGFMGFVTSHGLPAYSDVELFNDHPGSAQNIAENDAETYAIVHSLMANPKYQNNTLIIVTEDDTQNGANGADHVSSTYRVPLVVIGSPKYVKQHYLSHVAYTTSNVIAAMERVMENVRAGIIASNDAITKTTFPMTTSDQRALGDPLDDFWLQSGPTPLTATAGTSTTIGDAPLAVTFTGSAIGGTSPYTYSWSFGDGSTSTAQNPSHTYAKAGTYTATLTVVDSSSIPKSVHASVQVTASPLGGVLGAVASATPTSGQIPLTAKFTATGLGGAPPYTYSWSFGDGSTSTAQDPSHAYAKPGGYIAVLRVTDSAAPGQTVTAMVTISGSPIAATVPSAPRKLTAVPRSGTVTLNWSLPASDGGEFISAYEVFRGTSSGTAARVRSGGCSNLQAVLTCTDAGLVNGKTYYYYVIAANPIGTGPQSSETSAKPG